MNEAGLGGARSQRERKARGGRVSFVLPNCKDTQMCMGIGGKDREFHCSDPSVP